MRISDRMMQMNTMAGLRANLARLAEAQRHATSGKRIERTSDDPVDAAQAMRMDGQLSGIDQFKRNAVSATTRMSTETVVLKAARDLLDRARKLAAGVSARSARPRAQARCGRELGRSERSDPTGGAARGGLHQAAARLAREHERRGRTSLRRRQIGRAHV